ncbi:hypothetical protein PsorP6_011361 [Peronosclerospora sorghi]|uniref:Uncharacterized protein n=1 Tax=Peronosclerospora sorghi TaxID=230839 RepID=A0ACC0WJV1_9STRA|nr:hypothetical protein PsorP6_011361 [Peronosclerospora sorghi]
MLKYTLFTQLSHVPAVIKYPTDTWLPHKEKLVSACTKNSRHFGNTSTSAAEGSQVAEFRAAEATQRMRIPHTLRAVPDYANMIEKISLHALHLIEKQRSLSSTCTQMVKTRRNLSALGIILLKTDVMRYYSPFSHFLVNRLFAILMKIQMKFCAKENYSRQSI